MSAYTEAVERNLKGLTAVSTGICPGCSECKSDFPDYVVDILAIEDTAPGFPDHIWSYPATSQAFETEEEAETASDKDFENDWSSGRLWIDEPSFSWSGCQICDSALGGDFECWHGIDKNGEILHFTRACVDCVVYLANGDEPEGTNV